MLLCGGVVARVRLPVAHERHLVEHLPFRVGECPAPHPAVVGGQESGRHREPVLGNDEDQQPAVRQVAGAGRQKCVLHPLVFLVPIVGGIDKSEAEGPVGDGGLEQVRGQGAVEPGLGLMRPVPVQLHPVGLDGQAVGPAQALGELRQRLPRSAAGVEDADRLPVPVVVACGHANQPGYQVNDPGRRGIKAPFCLRCQSHVSPPSQSGCRSSCRGG